MAVYKLARFEVRPETREEAERAMHELASYVRAELDDSMWTAYRDVDAPNRYIALVRADNDAAEKRHREAPGTQKFVATVSAMLVGDMEAIEYELVTSSDLAPRPKKRGRPSFRKV